jgi:hypothetical protein
VPERSQALFGALGTFRGEAMIPPIKQLTVTSDGDTDDLTEHLLQVVQTDDTHIRNVTNLHNRSTL